MEEVRRAESAGGYDEEGNWLPGQAGEPFQADVFPLTYSEAAGTDFEADGTKVQILAEPGTRIVVGEILTIRGADFKVVQAPWDWSHGRKPWAGFHRMKVEAVAERVETGV